MTAFYKTQNKGSLLSSSFTEHVLKLIIDVDIRIQNLKCPIYATVLRNFPVTVFISVFCVKKVTPNTTMSMSSDSFQF